MFIHGKGGDSSFGQEAQGPERSSEYQQLYTDFLSEVLIFANQLHHHKINKNQHWHRKAALYSLNTITINVNYTYIYYTSEEFFLYKITVDKSTIHHFTRQNELLTG